MHTIKDHIIPIFWIAKSFDNTTIVYGCVPVGNELNTGQEELLTFEDDTLWEEELNKLGITEIEKICV